MNSNESNFSLAEKDDYIADSYINFSGKASLKITYEVKMTYDRDTEKETEWDEVFSKDEYKEIVSFEKVYDDEKGNPILVYKAIPYDRLLIQQVDYNLNNVAHITNCYLNATGNNLRIVCSFNSATTWNYFDGTDWQQIDNITVENVRDHGNTIDEIANIYDSNWNVAVYNQKIRFAYLLAMDNISDVEEIESLTIQYDSDSTWFKAKSSDYDVEISNTSMNIILYNEGDYKINYM